MSKIVIVILIYPRHKPTDLIYDYVDLYLLECDVLKTEAARYSKHPQTFSRLQCVTSEDSNLECA
jgi:hypothetical protein